MKRFKNILLVSGQAEATNVILERAVTLAQRNGGRLTVVDAVASLPRNISTASLRETSEELYKRLDTELIVMGTVCRTGLPGLLIGNTAEDVLGQVNCSVLTVKPEGFVSPVSLQDTSFDCFKPNA